MKSVAITEQGRHTLSEIFSQPSAGTRVWQSWRPARNFARLLNWRDLERSGSLSDAERAIILRRPLPRPSTISICPRELYPHPSS